MAQLAESLVLGLLMQSVAVAPRWSVARETRETEEVRSSNCSDGAWIDRDLTHLRAMLAYLIGLRPCCPRTRPTRTTLSLRTCSPQRCGPQGCGLGQREPRHCHHINHWNWYYWRWSTAARFPYQYRRLNNNRSWSCCCRYRHNSHLPHNPSPRRGADRPRARPHNSAGRFSLRDNGAASVRAVPVARIGKNGADAAAIEQGSGGRKKLPGHGALVEGEHTGFL